MTTPLHFSARDAVTGTTFLGGLGGAGVSQLKVAQEHLSRLVALREEEQQLLAELSRLCVRPTVAAAPPAILEKAVSAVPHAHPSTEALPLPASRKPMRSPQPGSVRALIYQYLSERAGVPCRRKQIVHAVAVLAGVQPSDCEHAVSAVLKNRFDPHLRRTGPAEYAYTEATTAVAAQG